MWSKRLLRVAARVLPASLIGVLALAACQPLPRPFQSEEKPAPTAAVIQPGAASGVFVREVAASPPGAGEALSAAVVEALKAQGIPASRDSLNRGSFILFGAAAAAPGTEPGTAELRLRWELMDPWDRRALRYEETRAVAAEAWEGARPEALEPPAEAVASRIALLLGERSAAPGPSAKMPAVLLLPVKGAPGDGMESLAHALAFNLRQAGLDLADDVGPGTVLIEGRVAVSDAGPGSVRLDIVWAVLTPEGHELGTVSQGGDVAAEAVAGAWGPLAAVVAENGAEGIAELLRKLPAAN